MILQPLAQGITLRWVSLGRPCTLPWIRADLASQSYALSHGAIPEQVAIALRSRVPAHKGDEKRQNQYVMRTVAKALTFAESKSFA